MERKALAFLREWLDSSIRKPLVIRGARQVGKTYLVRQFAELSNKKLIEVNLEKKQHLAALFSSNEPSEIVLNLSSALETEINPENSLLFLDEIQAAPELLAKLRWFAEDMPQLPTIAAGSLLEFVLEDHTFSMPVGRINYMHMEPLSFTEFLMAHAKTELLAYLESYTLKKQIPHAIHEKLMMLFREYLVIGGMPLAVYSWKTKRSLKQVLQVHHDLLDTYKDDFAKYNGRIPTQRMEEVFNAVPNFLGQKFIFSSVNPAVQSVKGALHLLCKARVCHCIYGTSANGVPLGAELLHKYLKVIFIDVGLCSSLLDLSLDQYTTTEELVLVNRGGIAEQVVGQLLRTIRPLFIEPSLYYWQRTEKGTTAEVDYVIQHKNKVVPIEVKAGKTGTLKSLHYFMHTKKLDLAVRINSTPPQQTLISTKDPVGNDVNYTLISIPFYLIEELPRLLS